MDRQDIKQLGAFARQDGALLALAWAISFVCTMRSMDGVGMVAIANLLALATPFIVWATLRRFRDSALGGYISFGRALLYCLQTFGCATLLLTVVQYLYLAYVDSAYLTQVVAMYKDILENQPSVSREQTAQVTEILEGLTPMAWVSGFMIMDLIVGAILSPVIALTGHLSSRTDAKTPQ